jgi:alpha-amylase/alpha-mannosidase (GH57 family)
MTERYLCVHGHFYQPPRQNPWLEEIEAEESAAPFHDWNERITAECYAPNTAARIVDGEGGILDIYNTYAHISFNLGPTLLAWLEKADPNTYQQIIDADHLSRANHGGHGNAIAQAYNHVIMPLAILTNYGQYLERFPPDHLVAIDENTSWSCAHGVERWRSDCGCQTGGKPGWHQRWRQPLRQALDWLRDRLAQLFADEGGRLLIDPWAARDAYIAVILDRSRASVERFFHQHARRRLSDAEVVHVLKLLEMQRHALLMYTSCAWFFAEISGLETVQMLAHAARAIQLGQEVTGVELESGFLDRLATAPSNRPQLTAHGGEVYFKLVKPAVATLRTVIADYAISALIEPTSPQAPCGSMRSRSWARTARAMPVLPWPRGACESSPSSPGKVCKPSTPCSTVTATTGDAR